MQAESPVLLVVEDDFLVRTHACRRTERRRIRGAGSCGCEGSADLGLRPRRHLRHADRHQPARWVGRFRAGTCGAGDPAATAGGLCLRPLRRRGRWAGGGRLPLPCQAFHALACRRGAARHDRGWRRERGRSGACTSPNGACSAARLGSLLQFTARSTERPSRSTGPRGGSTVSRTLARPIQAAASAFRRAFLLAGGEAE